jgi:hypothetical protein
LASSNWTQNPPVCQETALKNATITAENDRPGATLHPRHIVAERLLPY